MYRFIGMKRMMRTIAEIRARHERSLGATTAPRTVRAATGAAIRVP
jgi:hypothetical protein